jgi:hypothetical protein
MKALLALSLLASVACASTPPETRSSQNGAVQSCVDSLVPAVALRGSSIYAGPDGTTGMIATLKQDTPVCVEASSAGFGFRRVKFSSGGTGFVAEDNLSL